MHVWTFAVRLFRCKIRALSVLRTLEPMRGAGIVPPRPGVRFEGVTGQALTLFTITAKLFMARVLCIFVLRVQKLGSQIYATSSNSTQKLIGLPIPFTTKDACPCIKGCLEHTVIHVGCCATSVCAP